MSNTRKLRRPKLPLVTPGVTIINVRHDDHCPTLKTRQMDDCRCDPQLVLVKAPNVRQN